jgi:hypothetical protein
MLLNNKFMRVVLVIINIWIISVFNVIADEGMWLPLLLDSSRYQRMQELGCKLSLEDIYSINNSSLKDAVVLFDRGCTGVMVSESGLLLTNHHCGIRSIQSHSTLENNYLVKGYWAKSLKDELPNPSLKVSFLIRMEDVTQQISGNISPFITEEYRNYYIYQNIENLVDAQTKKTGHTIVIKPFFEGNQYFLFEYEVFTDVRLVGAPPSEIGKFGGDTDNWVWPRHTGDFSVFRVYAGKDNKPAPYSPENVPYKPKRVVKISLKGIEKDDFTMVYGFPGNTNSYLLSAEVSNLLNNVYPTRVNLESIRLEAMDKEMRNNPRAKIQYASKFYGVSNYCKKWQGAVRGLTRANASEIKRKREEDLKGSFQNDSILDEKYNSLLSEFDKIYPSYNKYFSINDFYSESVFTIELLSLAGSFLNECVVKKEKDTIPLDLKLGKFKQVALSFFKNYNINIDKQTFIGLMEEYIKKIPEEFQSDFFKEEVRKYVGNCELWADKIYSESLFCDSTKLIRTLNKISSKSVNKLISDPAIKLYYDFSYLLSTKVKPDLYYYGNIIDSLYRQYLGLLISYNKSNSLYPDANQTLRIAYGKVEGYNPADAVAYNYYTITDGILEKINPSIDDYHLSDNIKNLYLTRDFGRYADKEGNLRVCFTASNHTSGGNSGSPVFNATGELVGLNFDRCWEGTMSDVLYDSKLCRNITLDIRYLLFVIDKYAGANHLIDEMQVAE